MNYRKLLSAALAAIILIGAALLALVCLALVKAIFGAFASAVFACVALFVLLTWAVYHEQD